MSLFTHAITRNKKKFVSHKIFFFWLALMRKVLFLMTETYKKKKFSGLSVKSCFTLYAKICYVVVVVLEASLIHSVDSLIHSKKSSKCQLQLTNFGFEFVLTISWLNTSSMVISIVGRHPAPLLGKQRFERADA